MHLCKALYIKSVPVHEMFEGKTAWQGEVALFKIHRHPKATRCYAWSYKEGEAIKPIAVLEIPPVDSPQSAVKVAIASKARQ